MEVQKLVGDECYCGACVGNPACPAPTLPGLVTPKPVQQVLPGIPCASPSSKRYTGDSKQVLRDGVHFADACDENAASCIIDALNAAEEQAGWVDLIAQVK